MEKWWNLLAGAFGRGRAHWQNGAEFLPSATICYHLQPLRRDASNFPTFAEPNFNYVNSKHPLVNCFLEPHPGLTTVKTTRFFNNLTLVSVPPSFSGSEPKNAASERNRQGSGRTSRFLAPDSHILWSTGVFG